MAKTPVDAPVDSPADPHGLEPRQRAFVEHFAAHGNATQAAISAGYSAKTAKQQGSRLLTNANVQKALAERRQKRAAKHDITAERIDQELAGVAFAELALDPARVGEDGKLPVPIRPEHKLKALELLARRLGLLVDKAELKHSGTVGLTFAQAVGMAAARVREKKGGAA